MINSDNSENSDDKLQITCILSNQINGENSDDKFR
jgi:hypothetical protein